MSGNRDDREHEPASTSSDFDAELIERLAGREKSFGRYQLKGELAHGGQGAILRVWDEDLRRNLAMKVMLPKGESASTSEVDSKTLGRFLEEAQVTSQLDHPGIVPIHELGLDNEGGVYFTMRLVKGIDLARVFEMVPTGEEGWNKTRVLGVLLRVCEALSYAHSKRVIHRDLKPANIMVGRFGEAYVMDWGLARVQDTSDRRDIRVNPASASLSLSFVKSDRREQAESAADSPLLTMDGDVLGTPAYMSPEQARGDLEAMGPASDVYSMGAILYQLLAGHMPYVPPDARLNGYAVWGLVQNGPPTPVSQLARDAPAELVAICEKAMAREPASRYEDMRELAGDVRAFLEKRVVSAYETGAVAELRKWVARNRALAASMAAAVLVLALGLATSLVFKAKADANSLEAHENEKVAKAQAAAAEASRAAAEAETYRAMLSEVRAQRVGRPLGWREEALADLSRLAVLPTPRRDLVELRTEAVASLGEFGLKEVARLDAMSESLGQIDFSPDSRTLATVTTAGAIDLWDLPRREHLLRVGGATTNLRSWKGMVFLSNGDLAFRDAGGRVAFLGPHGRASVRTPIEPGDRDVVVLRTDLKGRTLAVGWSDGTIDLIDADSGALRRSVAWKWEHEVELLRGTPRPRGAPFTFVLSPGGGWLALQDPKGVTWLQSTSGEAPPVPVARSGYAFALAFDPTGSVLAVGAGRSLVLWDVSSKEELMSLGGHRESITGVAFSADGTMVATSCGDHLVRVWDARDGRPLTVVNGPDFMENVVFSPDGTYLAALAHSGTTCVYELEGGGELQRLTGHVHGVRRLVPHPRLPRFASGSDDHDVIVWDAPSARRLEQWTAQTTWVRGLAYSPDGSLLASTCGNSGEDNVDHAIKLWDAESGEIWKQLERTSHWGIRALAFDSTGRRLASADEGGVVLLWDLERGEILREEHVDKWPVHTVAFVDGDRELLVGFAGGVALYDLDASGTHRRFDLPQECTRVVLDEARERIVLGDTEGGLTALSFRDLSVIQRLERAHASRISSLAFRREGDLLATGGDDQRVVLRNPSTFEEIFSFPEGTGPVVDVAFDVSGRWLAFAGAESQVALWDLAKIREQLTGLGLAWDRQPPAAQPSALAYEGERVARPIEIVRPLASSLDTEAWAIVDPDGARQGDPAHALQLARSAVDMEPGNAKFRDTLAWALFANGLHEESLAESQRALEAGEETAQKVTRYQGFLDRLTRVVDEARQAAKGAALDEDGGR